MGGEVFCFSAFALDSKPLVQIGFAKADNNY